MPDNTGARRLADSLVEQGLAACVNILPQMTAIYKWQGKLEHGNEQLLLIKTRKECYSALTEYILDQHPYELPEIIAVPIENGLPEYLKWISENTSETSA